MQARWMWSCDLRTHVKRDELIDRCATATQDQDKGSGRKGESDQSHDQWLTALLSSSLQIRRPIGRESCAAGCTIPLDLAPRVRSRRCNWLAESRLSVQDFAPPRQSAVLEPLMPTALI